MGHSNTFVNPSTFDAKVRGAVAAVPSKPSKGNLVGECRVIQFSHCLFPEIVVQVKNIVACENSIFDLIFDVIELVVQFIGF